ncbi:MAG: hypothetical protein ACRYFS_21905 [Janthinobacterium lividum]
MPQAKYSEAQRAEILAFFEACGRNQSKTSRDCGVPRKTLQDWLSGVAMNEDIAAKTAAKKVDLADRIETLAHLLVDAAPGKIVDANLSTTMISLGIAVDKLRLLRDKPTVITNDVSLSDADRSARITQILDAARARGVRPPSVRN